MKCYVINLNRSTDRLSHIEREFARADVAFTRVEAVDGRLLTQEQIDSLIDPVQRWEIRIPPSEIGCFLSHRKCLEIIAGGTETYGAIFEDDIALTGHAHCLLTSEDWIPEGADVVKLDTFKTVVLLDNFRKIPQSSCQVARLHTKHLCCGGYIVSRVAARRILKRMDKISVPVDNLIFDPAYELFSDLQIHQVTPALCAQVGLTSLIEADRKQERRRVIARPSLPGLIVREIARSYRRSSHILSPAKWWTRFTTSGRWTKVPFIL
ncbi:glycosyltransferase family 25 protein [Pseudochrobactrum sp. HB0163]|uniref:glycosyltransferase family 25 protein n=1 Tax=Pseudochrobactrum sp. HB0163 TaxID=3450708 RepID=UPI003F6E1C11